MPHVLPMSLQFWRWSWVSPPSQSAEIGIYPAAIAMFPPFFAASCGDSGTVQSQVAPVLTWNCGPFLIFQDQVHWRLETGPISSATCSLDVLWSGLWCQFLRFMKGCEVETSVCTGPFVQPDPRCNGSSFRAAMRAMLRHGRAQTGVPVAKFEWKWSVTGEVFHMDNCKML